MKPNNSKRHHYIPKFFIKNFTDDDGLLFIYNKLEKKISNKKHSPKSIFFETNRNTVDFSGHKLDNLEKLYSELDNKISPDIKNVLLAKKITPEELVSITLLASLLKWRIPQSDEIFNVIKEDLTQEDLAITIEVKDKNIKVDEKAIEHIEKSDSFKETKRVLLAILPLLKSKTILDIYNYSFIQTSSIFPSVIGDCPVIEKYNQDIYKIEDFILPLSSTETFIYKQGCKKEIKSPMFFIQRDLAIMNSSEKYIGCKSKEHLEKIVEIYNQTVSGNQIENVHKYIFNLIE